MTELPSDWVTKWPSDQVTEWPSDQVTEWPNDWVTKWLSNWVTGSFADDWPYGIFPNYIVFSSVRPEMWRIKFLADKEIKIWGKIPLFIIFHILAKSKIIDCSLEPRLLNRYVNSNWKKPLECGLRTDCRNCRRLPQFQLERLVLTTWPEIW